MRTIKKLISNEKKVYIFLKSKEIQAQFMSDAEKEGIIYGDGTKPTKRMVDDIMALQPDGTICFLGFVGRMCYHLDKDNVVRIDYQKYINDENDCTVGSSSNFV